MVSMLFGLGLGMVTTSHVSLSCRLQISLSTACRHCGPYTGSFNAALRFLGIGTSDAFNPFLPTGTRYLSGLVSGGFLAMSFASLLSTGVDLSSPTNLGCVSMSFAVRFL